MPDIEEDILGTIQRRCISGRCYTVSQVVNRAADNARG